ncbi:hypothetical protein HK104_010316 [Borealophlyctis nickersoniae]|nr:hypothetical protein HK104_010316 [Borealophlyctis nickersoniae]
MLADLEVREKQVVRSPARAACYQTPVAAKNYYDKLLGRQRAEASYPTSYPTKDFLCTETRFLSPATEPQKSPSPAPSGDYQLHSIAESHTDPTALFPAEVDSSNLNNLFGHINPADPLPANDFLSELSDFLGIGAEKETSTPNLVIANSEPALTAEDRELQDFLQTNALWADDFAPPPSFSTDPAQPSPENASHINPRQEEDNVPIDIDTQDVVQFKQEVSDLLPNIYPPRPVKPATTRKNKARNRSKSSYPPHHHQQQQEDEAEMFGVPAYPMPHYLPPISHWHPMPVPVLHPIPLNTFYLGMPSPHPYLTPVMFPQPWYNLPPIMAPDRPFAVDPPRAVGHPARPAGLPPTAAMPPPPPPPPNRLSRKRPHKTSRGKKKEERDIFLEVIDEVLTRPPEEALDIVERGIREVTRKLERLRVAGTRSQ